MSSKEDKVGKMTKPQKAMVDALVENGGTGIITGGSPGMFIKTGVDGKRRIACNRTSIETAMRHGMIEPIEGDGWYRLTEAGWESAKTGYYPGFRVRVRGRPPVSLA